MEKYELLAYGIIRFQKDIIGPVAIDQAKTVNGLVIEGGADKVKIKSDGKKVIESLVNLYANLFGNASIEVCRDVVREIGNFSENDLPDVLR